MYHKILNLAFATVGLAALASCSSDDSVSKGDSSNDHSYLAITVKSVGETPATRDVTDGDFEYGEEFENKIDKIRLFFFDAQGRPFQLANPTVQGTNFIDKGPDDFIEEENSTTAGIAKRVVVDVVSNTKNSLPVSVIAIVNPDSYTGDNNLNVSLGANSLRNEGFVTTSYAKLTTSENPATPAAASSFLMSNSVYENNGSSTCAALISGVNIKTSQEEARKHPVDIYVERVAAKVRTKHATADWIYIALKTDGSGEEVTAETANAMPAYKVGTTKGIGGVTTESDVYAVVDGWGLADEGSKTPLEKYIGGASNWQNWTINLGINPWTTDNYHRCFWEITPAFTTLEGSLGYAPQDQAFETYKRTFGTDDKTTGVAYTFPNTPTRVSSIDEHTKNTTQTGMTKVLVAAHLMVKNADGSFSRVSISEYKGQQYLSENDVKTAILNENSSIWYEDGTTETDEDGNVVRVRKQLSNADLTCVTFARSASTEVKDYQVVAKLSEAAEGYTYYTSENGDETLTVDDVNNRISATPANVRHEGMTYYYTPIRHLGTEPENLGYFGVVRNHLYDVTINSIAGFGTPVYDPKKKIIPVVPSDEASYLSARINVLAWRIVEFNVDLNATAPTTPTTPTTEEGGETPVAPSTGD